MKVGPDAGAGANRGGSVAAAPAPIDGVAGVEEVRILRLRRRLARDANPEVLNLEIDLTLGEVIQAVKRTDRGGDVIVHGSEIGVADGARRALNLTRESGTCTCTRKGGCAHRSGEHRVLPHPVSSSVPAAMGSSMPLAFPVILGAERLSQGLSRSA